jgi:hypothetical protein
MLLEGCINPRQAVKRTDDLFWSLAVGLLGRQYLLYRLFSLVLAVATRLSAVLCSLCSGRGNTYHAHH